MSRLKPFTDTASAPSSNATVAPSRILSVSMGAEACAAPAADVNAPAVRREASPGHDPGAAGLGSPRASELPDFEPPPVFTVLPLEAGVPSVERPGQRVPAHQRLVLAVVGGHRAHGLKASAGRPPGSGSGAAVPLPVDQVRQHQAARLEQPLEGVNPPLRRISRAGNVVAACQVDSRRSPRRSAPCTAPTTRRRRRSAPRSPARRAAC